MEENRSCKDEVSEEHFYGLRRLNRVPRCGKDLSVSQRMDQGFLRCYGHVERNGYERLAKRVYESSVRGMRRRGRLRKCWMDGEKGSKYQISEIYLAR